MRREELVKAFVNKIDSSIEVNFHESEFFADIYDNSISITFNQDWETDELFSFFLYEEFSSHTNIFMMSLLHEVGHLMTNDDDMLDERDTIYSLLKVGYELSNNFQDYNRMYFHIPAEYEATAWAVNFYRTHKTMCDAFALEYERTE